ncbi:MAG: hypothetical protein ACXVX9_05145 [Mycobacteriaceae bacterium]
MPDVTRRDRWAARMLAEGVPLAVVQTRLRYPSTGELLRTHAHLIPSIANGGGICCVRLEYGEVCYRPRGHDGDHDPASTEVVP